MPYICLNKQLHHACYDLGRWEACSSAVPACRLSEFFLLYQIINIINHPTPNFYHIAVLILTFTFYLHGFAFSLSCIFSRTVLTENNSVYCWSFLKSTNHCYDPIFENWSLQPMEHFLECF